MPAARTSGCSITSMTARVYNPETVMPPWGTHGLFNDQEIRDIVAFLKTLKSPAQFADRARRSRQASAAGGEARQSRSARQSRHVGGRARADALEDQRRRAASPATSCHDDAAEQFKKWAATMPKWEPRLDKVLGVEEFVSRHAKATTGAELADAERREHRDVDLSAFPRQRRADQGRYRRAPAPRKRSSAARS